MIMSKPLPTAKHYCPAGVRNHVFYDGVCTYCGLTRREVLQERGERHLQTSRQSMARQRAGTAAAAPRPIAKPRFGPHAPSLTPQELAYRQFRESIVIPADPIDLAQSSNARRGKPPGVRHAT